MSQNQTAIQLTPSEIQSNFNRVKHAEGLIRQLPNYHEGRNSWLLNYGESDEAFKIKIRHILESNSLTNLQKIDKIVALVHPPSSENGCSVAKSEETPR